jgi:serine/threonine protein phosphatase PrpC
MLSDFVCFFIYQVCSVNLMEGDTIVSGSDGLFDNIFDQEIISIISESPGVDEAGKSLTSATGVTVLHLQSF